MSLQPCCSNRREKYFSGIRCTSCLKNKNQMFLPQDAEMSLTAMSLQESARRKFFMNSTYIMYIMSRMSLLESRSRKFFMNSTYIMSRK